MMRKFIKILEILFLVLVIVFSLLVFIFREKIGHVSNVNYLALFILCFIANSTIFLPAPSLMIAASFALVLNPFYVSLVAALGSTLGEYVGYAFGAVTKDVSSKILSFLEKIVSKIHNQTLLVFVLAMLPLPLFDFVGVYSGGTKMNMLKFFIACYLGKLIKLIVYTRMYDIFERVYSLM